MEERKFPGRSVECPNCGLSIRYSWLSGMSEPAFYFYGSKSNNVLLKTDWYESVNLLWGRFAEAKDVEREVEGLLLEVSQALGEEYLLWNNVKCPKCSFEFPYRFVGNLRLRLDDRNVILLDGCLVRTRNQEFRVVIE